MVAMVSYSSQQTVTGKYINFTVLLKNTHKKAEKPNVLAFLSKLFELADASN